MRSARTLKPTATATGDDSERLSPLGSIHLTWANHSSPVAAAMIAAVIGGVGSREVGGVRYTRGGVSARL